MTTPPPDIRPHESGGQASGLIASYRPRAGLYDEMMDENGAIRPHWRPLLTYLDRLGPDAVDRRFALADQHLLSSGAFYRVYDDSGGTDRPYPLSHVPLIVSADDWATIQAGLTQRANLLEAIIADLYGAQEICRGRLLPGALMAGSNDYLRPMRGITPRFGRHLVSYAADIGRDSLGNWWVLRDRTQAPSGSGYAIENRLALSRALSELYAGYGVARLAPYFETHRENLASRCEPDDAGVCLLTPGPLNETYFEHVFLSRYLGYRLVEGQDITVQDERVYLRTVQGLRAVNVILRRIDSNFADPIELDTRSRLGIPGLIGAMRAGRIALANALGTGVVEAPAFLGFLPALAKHLTGAPLAMPNVATWWCGQPAERAHVLANLSDLILAPAFSTAGGLPDASVLHGSRLSPAEREHITREVQLRSVDYIGQQRVQLSTTPVWSQRRLAPRPYVLRVYLTATDNGWHVLPGGLALVGDASDQTVITMQRGAKAADVWVLSPQRGETTSLLPSPEKVEIRRATGSLPSRAADNLFWLARYMERAETTLRVIKTLSNSQTESLADSGHHTPALVDALFKWGAIPAQTDAASAVTTALCDRSQPGSVASLLHNARNAGMVIRNRYPQDSWRTLVETDEQIQALRNNIDAAETTQVFVIAQALRNIAAITGLEQDNMNRLSGWRFLNLGRRIERGILVCRLVRHFAFHADRPDSLNVLLEVNDCQITYRMRYPHGAVLKPVLDLILLDDSNPRSLAFCIACIEEHLAVINRLAPTLTNGLRPDALRALHSASTALDLDQLQPHALVGVENLLMQISDFVTTTYFDLIGAEPPRGARP